MEGEFFNQAVSDLEKAIHQREKDQRMARTYGMHFIDYFPHRELGIVFYEMDRLHEAERELESSLSHFPTAKAFFYLDCVRKALIESKIKEVPLPKLSLDFKTDELWTKEDPVVISGIAEDKNYIAGIAIRDVPLFLEGSQKRVPFKESLHLTQGRHTIRISVKNLMEKVTRQQVVIHVDREGPIIILDELSFDQLGTKKASIHGSIHDDAGVADLSINGQPISISKGIMVPFTADLIVDSDSLKLEARDQLGNQTSALIPMTPYTVSYTPVMLASADSHGRGYMTANLFSPKDTHPPAIKLKGWTDSQTVFIEKAYIEGQVSDESKIESLTINGKDILRSKGQFVFFSYMVDLKKGENILLIQAIDEKDNSTSQGITITRRVPKVLQLSERLSLTALPFEQKGEVSEASLAFQDNLIDALVNRDRFQVIERDKLDMILEEQKLSRTKLFTNHTVLKLGRLVAAQNIITGSILETRKGIEVVARMVDTETTEILATVDVYDEVKDITALRLLAEGMAIKFHRNFPLVDGLVIECKENNIFTDLGRDVINIRRRLIVYREEMIKHPLTGKAMGADNEIIGHARVTQVMPEMSKAELLESNVDSIRRLDKVITE